MVDLIATNKVTVIVGLGVTGLSVARFFARNNQPFVVMDTRSNPPLLSMFNQQFPNRDCLCGPLDQELLCNAQQIILGPGLPLAMPEIQAAQQAGVEVIGDIELFARSAPAPIVAITGSNGKTTVTTLVGEMAKAGGLQVLVGGNIGVPALDLLVEDTPDYYILELSSFQLETTQKLNAHIAVVLNVTEDHMDRYANFGAYHAAKIRVFFGVKTMLVNRDAPLSRGLVAQDVKEISFGMRQPDLKDFGIVRGQEGQFFAKGFMHLMPVSDLCMRGQHNQSNALAAMAMVDSMGALNEGALNACASFPGVKHRCQTVAVKAGVTYINDSKATNVGATLAALSGLSAELATGQSLHIILGGQGKGADFSILSNGLGSTIKTALIMGEDAPAITQAVTNHVETIQVGNMAEAVHKAAELACEGDIVLLSPACASFDMYPSYEHRGDDFISKVQGLSK